MGCTDMEVAKKGISVKNLKIIIIAIFAGFVVLFGVLYYMNKDFMNLVNNALPFNTEPSYVYSIYGSGMDGTLKKPMGVTVANDQIYVTDTGNGRVQIFDYNGNFIKKFGEKGEKEGQFLFPYGIAVSGTDIYVADFYTHKVSVFDGNGKFKKYFGRPDQDYSGPGAIAISGDRLYMADINESKVKIFDLATGKKVKEFGKPGTGKGEFLSPNYLTVTGGRIYVTEAKNQRVQVFDTEGKYLLTFEERDPKDKNKTTSYLVNPRGIGVDGKGQVYVVSNLTSKVHIYDLKGKHISAFGEMGAEDEMFKLPNGLFVDSQGRIYITDTSNERVDVYQN